MENRAFLFGYGRHGRSIAQGLKKENFLVIILETIDENIQEAINDGFLNTQLIDVTKDSELESLRIEAEDRVVCVMDDGHLNVFLVLSIRSLFPDSTILSISDSIYTTKNLKKAGSDKVISLYEVSANRIHNILKRPNATKLLDGFVTDHSDIIFKEFTIPEHSMLDGKMVDEINFTEHSILLIGMVDQEVSRSFLFTTVGIEHKIDAGDVIVCIGRVEDLDNFGNKITGTRSKR